MSNRLFNYKSTDKYYILKEAGYWRIVKKTNGSRWNIYFNEDPQKIWDFKMANKINIERDSWRTFYQEFKGDE